MCTIVLGKSGLLACYSPPPPPYCNMCPRIISLVAAAMHFHVSWLSVSRCQNWINFTALWFRQDYKSAFSTPITSLSSFSSIFFFFWSLPPPNSHFSFSLSLLSLSLTFFHSCPVFSSSSFQKQPLSTSSAWMHLPWIWQRVFLLSDAQLISWMWVFS